MGNAATNTGNESMPEPQDKPDFGEPFFLLNGSIVDRTGLPSGLAENERAVVCMNALAGISDPAAALEAAREALAQSRQICRSFIRRPVDAESFAEACEMTAAKIDAALAMLPGKEREA